MDFTPSFSFTALSGFTMLVMLRLSLMRTKPFKDFYPAVAASSELNTPERVFLFASTVIITALGYLIQPTIESFLFQSGGESFKTAMKYWPLPVLTALMPGSITAYVLISADNQRTKWFRGCAASFFALTAFDFLVLIQGGTSIRGFFFCMICDLIGGPLGVVLVLTAHSRFRRQLLQR
ncbi:MAG: hypothetical protein EPO07_14220 [Verrucomicrobia bacterium]|nr:MAG: hypothetical protein EPO07_14220 [Verrucomicrobiota bacterium]